jgi:predicted transcriptional regulator
MAQSLVELAKELTLALVQTGNVAPEDIQETLQKTYTTLTALKMQEETGSATAVPVADSSSVNWRKSISQHAVTCLECGQAFKQLTIRHLGMHGLDGRSYRMKYAIPNTQPLAARSSTDRHRQAAREARPWEKTPNFIKGHARHGQPSPESDVEALHAQIDASGEAAPAADKRQRKKTPKKKTARRTRAVG